MLLRCLLAAWLLVPAPASAEDDQLPQVPAGVVIGKPYGGDAAPSRIRFINVRDRPVTILWISFTGGAVRYAEIGSGQEIVQPTYVAHRWLVVDAGDEQPLAAFISTRSAAREDGAIPIALIR